MSSPAQTLVVIAPEALAALVREQVELALAEHDATRAEPELVAGPEMARRIGVSRTTLHRLRAQGMPAIRVCDVYRYKPAAVIAWLEARK